MNILVKISVLWSNYYFVFLFSMFQGVQVFAEVPDRLDDKDSATIFDINSKWLPSMLGSIQELPFYPHRAQTGTDALNKQSDFDPPEVCAGCHVEIYQQWSSSIMSKSWVDPIYRALLAKASVASNGELDNFCTGCHTPIGLTSGKVTSQNNQNPHQENQHKPLPGVDCESCHNITARTGLDNGAYVLQPKANNSLPTKWGPRTDAKSPYHQSQYSALHTRSDFCATCHNVTHPFSHTPIERTYDEWLESPFNKIDSRCQDCHMPTYSGKSAIMGPVRPDIASHYFVGANVTLHKHFGDDAAAERSRQLLRSSASIEIDSYHNLSPGQEALVNIKVTNKNAGHKLPTGFPEGREVWIDLKVEDANGLEVYRLGQIVDGKTEPGTKNFKVSLGDKDGNVIDIEVWQVDHIIKDNRILPKGHETVNYSFSIPSDAKPPLTLSARLNYWSFPQKLVDELLGKQSITVEVVQIDYVYLQVGKTVASTQE